MGTLGERMNSALDAMARRTVWTSGRPVPAYRAAGVVGFHVALVVALTGALVIGRPMTIAIALGLVSAVTFLGWS